jgi:hypothetical protein
LGRVQGSLLAHWHSHWQALARLQVQQPGRYWIQLLWHRF